MMRRETVYLLLLLLSLSSTFATRTYGSTEWDTPFPERVLSIPGDPSRPAKLVVTVLTPEGPGPYPLAIMNHGSTLGQNPANAPRYHKTYSAYYFLSRGYAVALPMMRGYAGSEGHLLKHGCRLGDMGLENAEDIKAVINTLASDPNIDSSRVIVAGQSFGGWNTLAVGTLNIPGVRGLINFVGGVVVSDCPHAAASLIEAAGTYGTHSSVPSLWFYGDNDSILNSSTWHSMYDRYTAMGGNAKLVTIGTFNTDSHQFLSYPESQTLWIPEVDTFLASLGMPSTLLYPQYLPTPFPQASGYAAIDDVNSVPFLNDQGRIFYQKFLEHPVMTRVIVVSAHALSAQYGGFDPIKTALDACQKNGGKCFLYAVDNNVVWHGPKITPPSQSHYATVDDIGSVPYLNDKGREVYKRFLGYQGPRAFVVTPKGFAFGWYGGPNPLLSALTNCQTETSDCQPYAINDYVVWHP